MGACIAIPIYLYWDKILMNARSRNAPWCRKEEMRRLPLACIGGPILVVSMFIMGWTARKDIHWVVPVLAGVPFGVAFLLIFMGLINCKYPRTSPAPLAPLRTESWAWQVEGGRGLTAAIAERFNPRSAALSYLQRYLARSPSLSHRG